MAKNYSKAFRDNRGRLIAVYEPSKKGSLQGTWEAVQRAYERGRLNERIYSGWLEFFAHRGINLQKRTEEQTRELIDISIKQKPKAFERFLDDILNYTKP